VWDNVTAADVAAGQFGANTGGGDYSFPGKVSIGTPTPIRKLHIVDNVSVNVESLLIQNNGARASLRLYGKSSLDAGQSSANVQFFDQDTTHNAHLVFESRSTNAPLAVWINGSRRLGIYGASTSGMSVGSYAGIVPPSNGMIIPGSVGIGTPTPNSKLHVAGAISTAIAHKTAAYTLTDTDSIVTCDASAGAFTILLPSAVGIAGRMYTIKKVDSSSNAVTVAPPSGQTIDGAARYVLSARWKYVTVVSNGSNWLIIANN
jgi:hypothetical protein